jgi:hypothetical protein
MAEEGLSVMAENKAAEKGWGIFGVIALGFLVYHYGFGKVKKSEVSKVSTITSYPLITTPTPSTAVNQIPYQPKPVSQIARIHVTGKEATAELQKLFSQLTQAEIIALGLSVVLTGNDIYAGRIKVSNTGSVPVQVFPENVLIHFGDDSVRAYTINYQGFFRQGVLNPGKTMEGLVLFKARIDIGAAIRLFGFKYTYGDDSIQVTYD